MDVDPNRLRELARLIGDRKLPDVTIGMILNAADEIERLRAELVRRGKRVEQ